MSRAGSAEAPIVEVTRAVRFSAAHRLHNPRFSPEDNARIYGRCNYPTGHGHTYRLEVTIRGPVSPETGWVEAGATLGDVVQSQILRRFDRANLDRLIGPADGPTCTSEMLAGLLWRIMDPALGGGRLWRLRLEETPNNSVDLCRDRGVNRWPTAPHTPDARGEKVSPA